MINYITAHVRTLIDATRRSLSPHRDNHKNDDDAGENPITDLYNRALIHPATTIGLLAAAVGVSAAIAFVLAEQRAQKGIDRVIARKGKKLARRVRNRNVIP